ncbi:hypothetical protein QDR37_01590 [Amnibacterium sp. CER49]|uniref:hypothetical protein n=1 Tax=Amnibacterium sp. CER49 TaxID=3039161 RepID=UPI0024490211|nr:hypothetical protein [Amnibacterium sp. CER49]MDH2442628.1 hypothetical protein [Amnibacterium sp. CER49]
MRRRPVDDRLLPDVLVIGAGVSGVPCARRILRGDAGIGRRGDGWGAPGGIEGAWLPGDAGAVVDLPAVSR